MNKPLDAAALIQVSTATLAFSPRRQQGSGTSAPTDTRAKFGVRWRLRFAGAFSIAIDL